MKTIIRERQAKEAVFGEGFEQFLFMSAHARVSKLLKVENSDKREYLILFSSLVDILAIKNISGEEAEALFKNKKTGSARGLLLYLQEALLREDIEESCLALAAIMHSNNTFHESKRRVLLGNF